MSCFNDALNFPFGKQLQRKTYEKTCNFLHWDHLALADEGQQAP